MNVEKIKWIGLLMILCVRISFLFGDVYFENASQQVQTSGTGTDTVNDVTIEKEYAYIQTNTMADDGIDSGKDNHGSATQKSDKHISVLATIEENMVDLGFSANDIDLQDTGLNLYDDIESLEKIYEKKQTPEIFNLLISKLIKGYQFEKAKSYLSNVDIFGDNDVSIRDYIYVYINTLSITDNMSIYRFSSFIDEAKEKSFIGNDDYIFYKGLVSLWEGKYNQAMSGFATISNSFYSQFISQLSGTIANYSVQQGAPTYYEDALIAMVCLKNGYFSLANKLSVQASLQNGDYILPYQVLSYSNFLTQNREKAVDYFYKLSAVDSENYEKYNFYIGISYYRYGNYEKSIAALVPLLNTSYKDDAYRYLLLDYEKIGDENKMIQIWQKQLGTTKLKASDFTYFFDQIFFLPFANGEPFDLYKEYRQMAYDFVSLCYEKLGSNTDACIYGSVGLDIANSNRNAAIDNLLYLAENYPQASIYQALGNYYKMVGDDHKSKTYFLKAVSMSENTRQKNFIESTLLSLDFQDL